MLLRRAAGSAVGRVFGYLYVVTALFIALAGAASADPVFPPGSRVGLEPPGEMLPSTRFPGFEDADRHASIAILDLPGSAYNDLNGAAFSKGGEKKLQDVKRESFPFANGMGLLITGVLKDKGATFHRWSLLAPALGGPIHDLTAVVNAEVPDSAISVYSDAAIRKALASVVFRPAPIQEQLGLLPFKFEDLAGFQVVQVMPTGVVVLADKENAPQQALIIVSVGSGGPLQASDRARFARDLLTSAPVNDLTLQSAESMRIDGAPGHEIRAQGVNPAGQKVSMVQWLRFGTTGFLRIFAVSSSDKWDAMFGRFRAVRDGIDVR